MLSSLPSFILISFPVGLCFAAVSDFHRYIIPNWTSLLLIAGFAICFALSPFGVERLAHHIVVFAIALGIGFGLFCLGLWGGGDGKLLAATALWFTWPGAMSFMLYMSLAGGALALLMLLAYLFQDKLRRLPGLADLDFEKRRSDAPYGVAIAVGALIAFPDSEMFRALALGG
ncbi:MAG: prepilin peptidase [Pseudomonadota bacterium]